VWQRKEKRGEREKKKRRSRKRERYASEGVVKGKKRPPCRSITFYSTRKWKGGRGERVYLFVELRNFKKNPRIGETFLLRGEGRGRGVLLMNQKGAFGVFPSPKVRKEEWCGVGLRGRRKKEKGRPGVR